MRLKKDLGAKVVSQWGLFLQIDVWKSYESCGNFSCTHDECAKQDEKISSNNYRTSAVR